VCYSTEGFLDKNADRVNPLVQTLIQTPHSPECINLPESRVEVVSVLIKNSPVLLLLPAYRFVDDKKNQKATFARFFFLIFIHFDVKVPELLLSSSSALVRALVCKKEERKDSRAASVTAQFRCQLSTLIDRISATNPFFVRCIKVSFF